MIKVSEQEFKQLFEERVQKCRQVLVKKAQEYSSDDDKMRNFNVVARMLNMKPYQVAFLFMMKHFESLYEIIMNGKEVSPEMWDEKMGDTLNYLFLIDAMWIKERRRK